MLNLFLLGFSAGLPLALTASTLQAWCTVSGVDILTLGMLSLVGQPYVYKFLWAPFMDRFVLPCLGRRRGWMLFTQTMLLIAIASFACLDPAKNPLGVSALALFVAFLSASQDVAVDAYRTEILKPDKRGMGVAWFANGYRFAVLTSGGIALIMADRWGWSITYLLMSLLMSIGIFATFFAKEPGLSFVAPPATLKQAVVGPFRQLISQDQIFYFLLLIVLYKLSDALISSLGSTFLIRDLGFSLTTIGTLYKTVGLFTTLIGLFLGGWLMERLTLLQALFRFGIAQLLSNIGFVVLSIVGKNTLLLGAVIVLENLCNGMCVAALLVLLMSLCDPRYTATQFALLSAFAAIGRTFVGPFAAMVVVRVGWTNFYIWVCLISLLPLLLIWKMRSSLISLTEESSYA
jgi:MFS transporter, PAT family, beta-lactamase induction signal transducer AmpG